MNRRFLWVTRKFWGEPCEFEKYPLTWGDASGKVCPVPESATPTGTGEPSLWGPPPGGVRRKTGPGPRFGKVGVSGAGARDECHRATSDGRPVRRAVGRSGAGPRRRGATPTGSSDHGLHGARSVPRTCPGQRDCTVTATGRATGDRADNAASPAEPSGTTGDVRSSERLTPAGRPSVDGSSHLELPRAAQRLRPQRSRGGSLFRLADVWARSSPDPDLGAIVDAMRRMRPVRCVRRRARTSPCTAAPRRGRRGRRSRRWPCVFGPGHGIGAVVDRVDRADLGGGAADEDLLGDVQVAAGDVVDAAVDAEVAGDRHHRALRDALQRPADSGGVSRMPLRDTKMFSPVHSATSPLGASMIASS